MVPFDSLEKADSNGISKHAYLYYFEVVRAKKPKIHERADVVVVRNKFVDYFTRRNHLYYTLTAKNDDLDNIEYEMPMRQEDGSKKVALFSHDESTLRS